MLRPLDGNAPYDTGPYRLLGGLGSGGMGTVHLALPPDGGPDDLVALKTVRRDLELHPDFRVRFRREAEAAGAVRSPYVSALVAADPDAERPWLATEYVAGPPLDEAVSRAGALPVPVVRELGADLARGLAAVHGARLVHRDLKPGNVVLGTRGPRLIDFGIAQAYDATALTATGIMVGSPGFMSPEHVAGDRSVTAASDVFCLGAVLCFTATGRGPFHDTELAAIVHRIAQGRPDLSEVPGELRELIAACLAPDPADRPTTTRLIRELDPAAANARPGVAPAPRTGAFPWPAGVARLIGEYETAVGRALLAPPAPQRAPGPAAAAPRPGPVPGGESTPRPESVPDAAPWPAGTVPARSRRSARLRWAAGVTAGLVVGVATAVVMSVLDGGGADGGGSGDGAAGAGGSAGAAPSVLVSSDVSDFGPDAMDRSKLSGDWSPWQATFESDGEPRGCVLGDTTLVCRLHQESGGVSLEARNADDGTFLWRYPDGGTADGSDAAEPDLDGTYAYASSARRDGISVLRLADGEPVATVDAPKGNPPRKVRVHGNRLFIAHRGGDGTLVRAHSTTGDREQQWERRVDGMEPGSLETVGDSVHLHGRAASVSLDPVTGRTLAKVSERCEPMAAETAYVSCPSGVRDGRTLKPVTAADLAGRPLAVSRDGTLLSSRRSTSDGYEAELVARDLRTGRVRWAEPWSGNGVARVAGDKVIAADESGVRLPELAGGGDAFPRTFGGWPQPDGERSAPPPTSGLVHGGALFVTFENGRVLSVLLP
ncbi:protein kinase domain-containing protein [Streptomyces sp. HMX87]|uniref:serine/threonine-protein kinase n=1 Tax=Streptomyces sp. HMX87 TaxID=3390849 RepID=UPI003A888D9B